MAIGPFAVPSHHKIRFVGALVTCLLFFDSAITSAQGPAVHYVYDDHRLVAVIDQQGNVATWAYDAVGNILRVDRFDSAGIPGDVGITLVAPGQGQVGTEVEIFGKGFGATPGENTVSFNGVAATVTRAAPNRLVTYVPAGATTGAITVTASRGAATSPDAFVVLGSLAIEPASATVIVNDTQPFVALVDGVPSTAVRWAVYDITGGDASLGTISDTGLYRAPAAVPTPATVRVSAVHREVGTVTASVDVTIVPPIPVLLETAVSIGVRPVITSMVPDTAQRGTTVAVTILGSGFSGASGLVFLRGNTPDPSLGVTNLVVSGDGRQVNADITIDANATVGDRVVQIVTPAGSSTRVGTGGNVLAVR